MTSSLSCGDGRLCVSNSAKDFLYEIVLEMARRDNPEAYHQLRQDGRFIGCHGVSGMGFALEAFAECFGDLESFKRTVTAQWHVIAEMSDGQQCVRYMEGLLERSVGLLDAGAGQAIAQANNVRAKGATGSRGHDSSALVAPIPAPFAGKVLTLPTKLIENAFLFVQFLVLGIFCLMPLPVGIAIADGCFGKNDNRAAIPVCLALVVSFVLILWVFVRQLVKNPWSSRYLYYKVRKEFRHRPDAIVDLKNPEAILVQVIPRQNWQRIMLEDAADVGFLFVDLEGRQLLFEGDHERYRVPARALLTCGVELMNPLSEVHHKTLPVPLVVISFREADRVLEIPLRPLCVVSGEDLGDNYPDRSFELECRIASLLTENGTRPSGCRGARGSDA
jgi:hypothetical protein